MVGSKHFKEAVPASTRKMPTLNFDILHTAMSTVARKVARIRGIGRLGAQISARMLPRIRRPIIKARMRDGTHLFLDIRSRTEVQSIWTGDYEVPVLKTLKSMISVGGVMLDVGANIGFVSIHLGDAIRQMGGGGRIIGFEPVESNFQRLCENVEVNNLGNIITTIKSGLGAKRMQAVISMDNEYDASTGNAVLATGLIPEDQKGAQTEIQIQRLDDLAADLNLQRLDLIKVDIEGAEIMFMRGAIETLKRFRPIVFGEFNSCFIQRFGNSIMEADAILRPMGYDAFKVENNRVHRVSQLKEGDMEILFVPEELSKTRRSEIGIP